MVLLQRYKMTFLLNGELGFMSLLHIHISILQSKDMVEK